MLSLWDRLPCSQQFPATEQKGTGEKLEPEGHCTRWLLIRGGLHVVLSTEDKTTLARTIAASATWRERTGYLV